MWLPLRFCKHIGRGKATSLQLLEISPSKHSLSLPRMRGWSQPVLASSPSSSCSPTPTKALTRSPAHSTRSQETCQRLPASNRSPLSPSSTSLSSWPKTECFGLWRKHALFSPDGISGAEGNRLAFVHLSTGGDYGRSPKLGPGQCWEVRSRQWIQHKACIVSRASWRNKTLQLLNCPLGLRARLIWLPSTFFFLECPLSSRFFLGFEHSYHIDMQSAPSSREMLPERKKKRQRTSRVSGCICRQHS